MSLVALTPSPPYAPSMVLVDRSPRPASAAPLIEHCAPSTRRRPRRAVVAIAFGAIVAAIGGGAAAAPMPPLEPCRLTGVPEPARCGKLVVAEDPAAAGGRTIEIHFAVVPALAQNKAADPLFVLAGGPGQAATKVAGQLQPGFAQINARRDIVYIDQRGTGKSHPLNCERPPRNARLADALASNPGALARITSCLQRLDTDPALYATAVAVTDLDAVRRHLGYARINLWGASYGTRVALDYLRQFPQAVRSAVLDGVAPPDMALPLSFTLDADAALQALITRCAAEPACAQRRPDLAAAVDRLFARLDRADPIAIAHPMTGAPERLALTRSDLAAMLRAPLYVPNLAAVVPFAIERASAQDYGPLAALAGALSSALAEDFAEAMHFAVVCTEDMPRIDAAARQRAVGTRFGTALIDQYDAACRALPRGDGKHAPPPAFYRVPAVDVPVLILSGGADPATPPRHGAAVAAALGRARHLIAPNLGHGVSMQACAPDLITRFIRQASFDEITGECLERIPAPGFFAPVTAATPP